MKRVRFDDGNHPYIPLDYYTQSPIQAVRRVLCRLEFATYWAYRDEGFEKWYAAGFGFIRDHFGKVVKQEQKGQIK